MIGGFCGQVGFLGNVFWFKGFSYDIISNCLTCVHKILTEMSRITWNVFFLFGWRCFTLSCSFQLTATSFPVFSMTLSSYENTEQDSLSYKYRDMAGCQGREIDKELHTGLFLLLCSSKACRNSRIASCWNAFPNVLKWEHQMDHFLHADWPSYEVNKGWKVPVGVCCWVHLIWYMTPCVVDGTE